MPDDTGPYRRSLQAPPLAARPGRRKSLEFAGGAGRAAALALSLAALAALSGCGSGSQPLSVVDPAAAPAHPEYTQVETILKRACAPCHKSSGGGEFSEDLDYSDCAGITSPGSIQGIRQGVFQRGDMPPGAWPRIDQREQLILKRWIADGARGPCKP